MGVQICVCILFSLLLGICPEVELWDHVVFLCRSTSSHLKILIFVTFYVVTFQLLLKHVCCFSEHLGEHVSFSSVVSEQQCV